MHTSNAQPAPHVTPPYVGCPTLAQLARPGGDDEPVVFAPSLSELRRSGAPPLPIGEQRFVLPYGLQPWGKLLASQPGLGRFRKMAVPAIGVEHMEQARPRVLLLTLTVSYDVVPVPGVEQVLVSLSVDKGDTPARPEHRGDWHGLTQELTLALARQGLTMGHIKIVVEPVGTKRVESIDAAGLALPMLTAIFDGLCGGARRGRVAPTSDERRWERLMPPGGFLLPVGDLAYGDRCLSAASLPSMLEPGSPVHNLGAAFNTSGLVPVLMVAPDDVQVVLDAGLHAIGCDVASDLRLLISGDKRRAPLPRVPQGMIATRG